MNNRPDPTIAPPEGQLREQLATYFLSMPPFREQTHPQQEEYRHALRQLGQLENREVLSAAGTGRTLVWGNPVPLLQNLLSAAQELAAGAGQPLLLFPATGTSLDFQAMFHPRILSLATVNLLRIACLATDHQPVWARISERSSCLTLTVSATVPFSNPEAQAVIRECARLHGGSLAQCECSMGFSCSRATEVAADARPYHSPEAAELRRDTLSCVWTGFYSWLDCSSGSSRISAGSSGSSEAEDSSSPEDGSII